MSLSHLTLTEVEEGRSPLDVDVLLVDRVGILVHLYELASASYVGGGFHNAGLHSVIEPAAAGSPVVFGHSHHAQRAAADLLRAGAAKLASDSGSLASILLTWLKHDERQAGAGGCARDYIEDSLGAAARSASVIEDHVPPT